jgi:iron complex transport system substrate-binding protein
MKGFLETGAWKFRHAKFCGMTTVLFLILCDRAIARQTNAARAAIPPSRELTDEVGRKIQIPRDINRVVSLAPNLTEIVFALGEGNQLAGDTDFCDYPPEAARKPHVGGPVNPNLEEIVALKPELVLATKSINRRETVNALGRIGLPVYVTEDPHSIEGMIASVKHLGSVLGAETSAATLTEDLRGRLADLDHRLAGVAQRRVLFVVWTEPLISVGRDTFIADALRRAGGRSVVETKAEWPHVSMEEIVRLQPEYILFTANHSEADKDHELNRLRAQPAWKALKAIQMGDILKVDDEITKPSPGLIGAIEQIAHALHREAFSSAARENIFEHEAGMKAEVFANIRQRECDFCGL